MSEEFIDPAFPKNDAEEVVPHPGDLATEMRLHQQRFVLHPEWLNGFSSDISLEWETVIFSEESAALLPNNQGVYAFAVQSANQRLPPHSYILYVGKTDRPLRRRFNEYISDQKLGRPKNRPHVWDFVTLWKTCLHFHYAEVPTGEYSPETIERSILDAIIPPRSILGFSANVSQAKKIWTNS